MQERAEAFIERLSCLCCQMLLTTAMVLYAAGNHLSESVQVLM
jgi:hypothetical protein